jgi:hypothetical protein
MKRTAAMVLMMTALLAGGGANAAAAGWRTYTDPKLGFSIAYPPGWKVNTRHESVSRGPDYPIPGVAFHIPPTMAAGTNLSSDQTFVAVESQPGRNCRAAVFLDPVENEHKLKADGRTYTAATSGDAGAGNLYSTWLFVIDGTSPCMAVRYFVHSTNIGNYDPGTIKAFDEKKLIATFDNIRATLKLKGQ